jgi:hypothetical protein
LESWAVIPKMNIGKNVIPKQGWVQISDNVPEEAAAIIAKQAMKGSEKSIEDKPLEAMKDNVISTDNKPLEAMKGNELLHYIRKNNIKIEKPESLTQTQLINEIRKVSAHN